MSLVEKKEYNKKTLMITLPTLPTTLTLTRGTMNDDEAQ